MLDNGFRSGCLSVISNDFESNYNEVFQYIYFSASQEWSKFSNWKNPKVFDSRDFISYYKLNKNESLLFNKKAPAPTSYIKKYCNALRPYEYVRIFPSLAHEKNPNTICELINGFEKHELYKVKCNICNRTYFMDEKSITCVKWRSCSGAKCLSNTVSNEICTYENLCKVNNSSTSLNVLDKQLLKVESLTNPLSYYGGYKNAGLHISYISDIHLLHHQNENHSLNFLIHNTVKQLYKTMDKEGIILFDGDVSSDTNTTIEFFKQFVKYTDLNKYRSAKKDVQFIQDKSQQIIKLTEYIYILKSRLLPHLDFENVSDYKDRYHMSKSWLETIRAYKKVKSYTSKNISDRIDRLLELIARKLDLIDKYRNECNMILFKYKLYNFPLEDLSIQDFYSKHHMLSDDRDIIVVLGNHEYIGFNSVDEAVTYYKSALTPLGVKLLQNDYYDCYFEDNHYIIYGGTGFAKYNARYNADTLVCCNNFTRDIEIKETAIFETKYKEAKQKAVAEKACFICVSHYPAHDCLSCIDHDAVYFYGHNHQNYYHRNEQEIIYADNQIGYENPNIGFKIMTTGVELNPYFALEDGLYKTSIEDYLQFYKYIGEFIRDGSLLYQRCQNDKASMYVIKRRGYYGFFILNPNKGSSKGISIVNGGMTKKVTKSTDLQWLFDNFEVILSKYLQLLIPLRTVQDQISKELQDLGFSGSIHGCIIDIDYYHHIMLNPIDGTVTYYYSLLFGFVQSLPSFENVIASIKEKDVGYFPYKRNYELIQQKYNDNKQNPNYILGQTNNDFLLESPGFSSQNMDTIRNHNQLQKVSRSGGMYAISRKINQLQKLFSGHVLRAFHSSLIESVEKQETQIM